MHRALIVAAVSTIAQAADDKASLPRQLEDCRAECVRRGWDIAGELVIPGHSRAYNHLAELVADCPEYGRLIQAVASETVTLLVAWAYDRLWRTDALRGQVTALCREHRVQIYALNQPVEPAPDGAATFGTRVIETFGGLIAESENETRVRRSKAGKENRVRQGFTQYSCLVPYGYRKRVGSNILELVPSEARLVRWIYNRRALDRWSVARIRRELNQRAIPSPRASRYGWSDTALRKILLNPIYKGAVRYGDVYCEQGRHEAVIAPDLWEQAQIIPPTREHVTAEMHLLSGMCRCGFCGRAMVYSPEHGKSGLSCSLYKHYSGKHCRSNFHRAAPLEDLVIDSLAEALSNPAAFLAYRGRSKSQNHTDERGLIERELAECDAQLERWRAAYGAGLIDLAALDRYTRRISAQADAAHKALAAHAAADQREAAIRERVYQLAPLSGSLRSMSPADQRDVVKSLIERIILARGQEAQIIWL
jgi:site-specific DNA recombinase